jgi:hypothetical protein
MSRKAKLFCEKHGLTRTPKIRLRSGKPSVEYYCKGCSKDHSERFKSHTKNCSLKKKYGINISQYNQLLKEQNHRCKICDRHESEFKRGLVVDHVHGTKQVRGLLCGPCNMACGLLRENSEIAIKAASYIALEGR